MKTLCFQILLFLNARLPAAMMDAIHVVG